MTKAQRAAARAYCDAKQMSDDDRRVYMQRLDAAGRRPSNQHKIARARAFQIATRRKFWDGCRALLPRSLRFFARFLPWIRRRLDDQTGALYRYNLARVARDLYEQRPGTRAFEEQLALARAKRKLEKAKVKKQLAQAAAEKAVAEAATQADLEEACRHTLEEQEAQIESTTMKPSSAKGRTDVSTHS